MTFNDDNNNTSVPNGLVIGEGNKMTTLDSPSDIKPTRRPGLKLTLSSDQRADFSAAIQTARGKVTSDASALPASTNMGLAKKPSSVPKPVPSNERAAIPTEAEKTAAQTATSHSWEEAETFDRPAPPKVTPKAAFLKAIPCFYVENVSNATSFYRDILGFSLLGKPDASHASLIRSQQEDTQRYSAIRNAPVDSVQIYLRISPMGSDGVRVAPPPQTLWILVADVDKVYEEIFSRWEKFKPSPDQYFPLHSFGDAKILGKPQNKAWGNRELHIVDGDGNKIIFFVELHR